MYIEILVVYGHHKGRRMRPAPPYQPHGRKFFIVYLFIYLLTLSVLMECIYILILTIIGYFYLEILVNEKI